MTIHTFALMLALVTAIAGCASTNSTTVATEFVGMLSKGQFAPASEKFDSTMQAAVPPEKLAEIWNGLTAQFGPFKHISGTRAEKVGHYDAVYVTSEFQRGRIDVKVVLDSTCRISGLWAVPSPPAEAAKPPSYVNSAKFTEREVTVGEAPWKLGGTLSLPNGSGPFPGVVLVHGSGPEDRDETVGQNKPFKDLAHGLASRGIAVLRYEKRTKAYPEKLAGLNSLTVKEEVLEDALAAATLLRGTKEVNPKKLFVLGHSLGGMLIPRIGRDDPNLAGLIVMAGNTRPMEDLMIAQTEYLAGLDGNISSAERKQIVSLKQAVERIKDPKLSPDVPAPELLGVPASYWLDLRNYHPELAAKSLGLPMFILQGGRDYQVTITDFQGWKRALSTRENVKFKLYPALNHLFMAGNGKSTPAEYDAPTHVSEEVIDDLAKWIDTGRR